MYKERIVWMDITRIIAILLVVFIHTLDWAMSMHLDLNTRQWLFYQSARIFGRVGVPLFLFLSGALILPGITKVDMISFYSKKIPHFLLLTIFYFLLTNIFTLYIHDKPIDIITLTSFLLSGDTMAAGQLWFMFSIIGLYFMAPFLARMIDSLKTNEIILLATLSMSLVNLSEMYSIFFRKHLFLANIGSDFISGNIIYFILGYLVYKRNVFAKTSKTLLLLGAVISFVLLLATQYYLKITNNFVGEGFTWYNSLLIILISLFIFALLSKIDLQLSINSLKLLQFFSKSSFCVFLFHLIPLLTISEYTKLINMNIYVQIITISLATYLLCLVYYSFMVRFKLLRKLIL